MNNENTSKMFCIIKLSAHSNWMQKQTCQNPFSAVVSMFITQGVFGRRRQGLDHKQPKHLEGVLHDQIETTAKTFRLQKLRGGGFHFPAFPVLASMPSISRSPLVGDSGRSMILGGGHFPCHKFPSFPFSIIQSDIA